MERGSVHARHILLFIEGLGGGGVERIALRLAAGWIAAGRRVTILTGDRTGPLAAEIPVGARLVDLATPYYATLALATVRAIGRIAPDIVFCPGNYYTAIAAAARLTLGRRCPPIIAKISNGFARADFIAPAQAGYRAWLRLHPRFIDRFVALSAGLRDEAIAMAGIAPARIVTIANPAAPPPPLADGPRAPLILAVGRLVAQKRFERLIEAFAHLPRGLGARLVLLGEGPERARLTAAAMRAGVAGRVYLPGHVADPLPWMARARVVALSSDYEGLPNVLAEALAVGTPVVTTACSAGIADLVHDPRLGSIVPIGDSAAMATALGHWYAATPDRATLRRLARPEPAADPARRWLAEMDALVATRGAIAATAAPVPLPPRSAPIA